MKQRILKVIKSSAVLLTVGCAYAFFVYKTGFSIPCVFRLVTGFKCPGCGITHMIIHLLRFDIKDAWLSNQAILVMSPLFLYLFCAKLYRYIRYNKTKEPKYETVIEIIIVVALVMFGIARNIPHIADILYR